MKFTGSIQAPSERPVGRVNSILSEGRQRRLGHSHKRESDSSRNPWGDPEASRSGTLGAKLDLIQRLESYLQTLERPADEIRRLLQWHSADALERRSEWEFLTSDVDEARKRQGQVRAIIRRLKDCGTTAAPNGGPYLVVRQAESGGRHLSGICSCGRHLCPRCGHWNAQQRRERLNAAIPMVAQLGRHFHAVFTLRHRKGVKWRTLADAQRAVWNLMVQRRQWKGAVVGHVRVPEADYTRNGWHHHMHVLISLKKQVDSQEFAAWMERFWQVESKLRGRSADWSKQKGWFTEIPVGKLKAVIAYQTKSASDNTPPREGPDTELLEHTAAAEVLGGANKTGHRPWDLPTPQFVELWYASKRFRWFSVGGAWKTPKVAEVESDEQATETRELVGNEITFALKENWKLLQMEDRHWLLCIIKNRELDLVTFLERWDWFWRGHCEAHGRPDTDAVARLGQRRAAMKERALNFDPAATAQRSLAIIDEPRPVLSRTFENWFGDLATVHAERDHDGRWRWNVSLIDPADHLAVPIATDHRHSEDAMNEALDWKDFELKQRTARVKKPTQQTSNESEGNQ